MRITLLVSLLLLLLLATPLFTLATVCTIPVSGPHSEERALNLELRRLAPGECVDLTRVVICLGALNKPLTMVLMFNGKTYCLILEHTF